MQNEISTDSKINNLFVKFSQLTKAANHFNFQSLYSNNVEIDRSVYGQVFEETLTELAKVQKQIVRLFLRSGNVGELLSHIEVGTFGQKAIQAAMNRI